jgi:hypothetical protein
MSLADLRFRTVHRSLRDACAGRRQKKRWAMAMTRAQTLLCRQLPIPQKQSDTGAVAGAWKGNASRLLLLNQALRR